MAEAAASSVASEIPTVDLADFAAKGQHSEDSKQRARTFVDACHRFGFVKVTGHGVSKQEIREALAWVKRLFDLPYEDKMKAPHPKASMPHRGYSPIGLEKVYSRSELDDTDSNGDKAASLRNIADFKESYEIGSEEDDQQSNIWLPEDVLPGFRAYMTGLYDRLASTADKVLMAFGVGLDLKGEDYDKLMKMNSHQHCQLRLLHYPKISKEKLENEVFARLPAHTDWGTFTMLFQDERGGLELQDPQMPTFLHATPEEGALVLNVADMLQRFSNDYFISATHRVAVPSIPLAPGVSEIASRYSIPFFVAPAPTHVIETASSFVSAETPRKYDAVAFQDYGAYISKYMYEKAAG